MQSGAHFFPPKLTADAASASGSEGARPGSRVHRPRRACFSACVASGQILNLLGDLRKERGYKYLFISHNLCVVRYVSDEVASCTRPGGGKSFQHDALPKTLHPYTQALLSAVPVVILTAKKERIILEGTSRADRPSSGLQVCTPPPSTGKNVAR